MERHGGVRRVCAFYGASRCHHFGSRTLAARHRPRRRADRNSLARQRFPGGRVFFARNALLSGKLGIQRVVI